MSKAALWADLKDRIIYPPFSQWTKFALVSAWLERWGVKELDTYAMGKLPH